MPARSAALALLVLAAGAVAQDAPDGWELVWQEDFDARDAAFEARWDTGTHTFDGNEAQFVDRNVVVEDGLLKLRLTREPAGSRRFSGAELRTDNQSGFFTYGRFEARMKAARGSGVISSLFTFRYNPWQEIDIEFKGRDTRDMQANIFFNRRGSNDPYEVPPFPRDTRLAYDAADEFHVYAFEWEPGVIRWYIDGVQVQESQDPGQVPFLPQQLMMNIWNTNLAWAGPLDADALPAEAQYDWVRVYRRPSSGLVFDTFDDGFVGDVGTFSETNRGVGAGPTADAEGAPDRAARVGIDPGQTGGYAGVVFPGPPATMDVTDATALTFALRPGVQPANLPLTLEINLHEDRNGDGAYDGATEDEYQALYTVTGASDFRTVTIPIGAFTDDNSVFRGADDGFDWSNLLEIVVNVTGPKGPAFSLGFDDLAFTGRATAGEPDRAAGAGLAVYPNPATETATAAFDLDRPGAVRLEVFDVLGRRVATQASTQAAGPARIPLAVGELGRGTYVVRVTAGGRVASQVLTVVR